MPTAAAQSQPPMTIAGFLAWSEEQPDEMRHEFVAGVPLRVGWTSLRHARIKRNASRVLRRSTAQAGLRSPVYDAGPGVAVGMDGDDCRIPDVVVTCATAIVETARLVPEPVIVVEMASPSTRLADVNDKAEFYGAIPSIRHYLVIEQGGRPAIYHGCGPSGGLDPRSLRGGKIVLDPPGIRLALDDLYRDTEFAQP